MSECFITRNQFGTYKTSGSWCEQPSKITQDQILQRMVAMETSKDNREQIHKNYQRLHAQYFDQKTSIVSAVVIGYKENIPYVYLARRALDGFLCLPGGRLDPRGYGRQRSSIRDETPLHAIVGEIKEETYATFDGFPCSLSSSFKCNFPLRFPDIIVRPRVEIFCFKTNFDDLISGSITDNGETDGAFWIRLSDAMRSQRIKKYYKTSIIKALRQRASENQIAKEKILSGVEITPDNIDEFALMIEATLPNFPLKTNHKIMQIALHRFSSRLAFREKSQPKTDPEHLVMHPNPIILPGTV